MIGRHIQGGNVAWFSIGRERRIWRRYQSHKVMLNLNHVIVLSALQRSSSSSPFIVLQLVRFVLQIGVIVGRVDLKNRFGRGVVWRQG